MVVRVQILFPAVRLGDLNLLLLLLPPHPLSSGVKIKCEDAYEELSEEINVNSLAVVSNMPGCRKALCIQRQCSVPHEPTLAFSLFVMLIGCDFLGPYP